MPTERLRKLPLNETPSSARVDSSRFASVPSPQAIERDQGWEEVRGFLEQALDLARRKQSPSTVSILSQRAMRKAHDLGARRRSAEQR